MNKHWILKSSAIALIVMSPCLAKAQANTDNNTLIAPPEVTGKSPTRIRLKTPPELPEADPFAPTPPGTEEEPLKAARHEAEPLAGAARNQAMTLAREGQRIAAQVQRDVLRATEDIKRSARDVKRVTVLMDGRQQTRTLVLPGERTTTEATWELTEDLDVMHRIVAKASGRRRDVEVEPYDAARVERLQTKLTAALKHAANIRNLYPNETVTIVVTGPAFTTAQEAHDETVDGDLDRDALTEREGRGGKGRGRVIPTSSGAPRIQNRESRLTLRAKKEDIDAVAEGKITADQLPVKITKSGP